MICQSSAKVVTSWTWKVDEDQYESEQNNEDENNEGESNKGYNDEDQYEANKLENSLKKSAEEIA